jgi:Icc-related predicted phosphoesterase
LKILAFSDLHSDVAAACEIAEASADADLLICAGDFATRGQGTGDIIGVLKTVKCPAVLVPGNHDNSQELRELCSDWDDGHLLHGNALTIAGITFCGLGGEVPQRNAAIWNEAVSEEEAGKFLNDCPDYDVLVTHTPPLGQVDLQRDGTHDGSTAIAAAIEQRQPCYSFCGHIHSSWGMSGKIGRTSVHNLGPTINWFEL